MKLYEKYFDELIELHPTINDYLQIEKYNHLKNKYPNSISKAEIAKQKRFYEKYLNLINKKKNLNHYDRVLQYTLKMDLKSFEHPFHLIPLEHMDNPISTFCENASGNYLYKFKTKQDYLSFIERTRDFGTFICTCINNMIEGIEKGITMPKVLAEKLLKQLKDIITTKPYLNNNIKVKLDIDYNKIIEKILVEYIKKLIYFLEKIYIQKCRKTYGIGDLNMGKKMYRYLAKYSVALDLRIDQIHNYGLKEIDRIHKEMLEIKQKLNFKGSLDEFNKYLSKRKDLKFRSKEDLLNTYRDEVKKINKTVMKENFKDKISHNCLIAKVPEYNEAYAASAYYMPGDIFGRRKGKFYMNLGKFKDLSKIEVESLTLHEANPGHHYQLTLMLDSNHPHFIKASSGNETSFEEGWGLYVESLGSYKTLESYYGKLNMEMTRALRLVVDTGIHYYSWSPKKCLKLMMKYSFEKEDALMDQIYRYMAIPGQALAYKTGEKKFLDLKKKYVDKAGMDIKEFHHKCLRFGSMPLYLLEKSFEY